ncbi:olfactory receptor 52K2-like [Rhinophrynus dorsalis]
MGVQYMPNIENATFVIKGVPIERSCTVPSNLLDLAEIDRSCSGTPNYRLRVTRPSGALQCMTATRLRVTRPSGALQCMTATRLRVTHPSGALQCMTPTRLRVTRPSGALQCMTATRLRVTRPSGALQCMTATRLRVTRPSGALQCMTATRLRVTRPSGALQCMTATRLRVTRPSGALQCMTATRLRVTRPSGALQCMTATRLRLTRPSGGPAVYDSYQARQRLRLTRPSGALQCMTATRRGRGIASNHSFITSRLRVTRPSGALQSMTATRRGRELAPNFLSLEKMKNNSSDQNMSISYTEFLLLGFPGISASRPLLVIPFLFIYTAILTCNSIIMYRIWVEMTLQSPMYWLISLLFAINISSTTAIMPKFLLSLAFDLSQISLSGCLVQMFVIYFTVVVESAVVLMMTLDRYVAICWPLNYHIIMTKKLLVLLTLISMARGVILISPIVIPLSGVQFCRSNVILSFACENMGLLNLGCGDISKMHITGLFIRIFVSVIDGTILLISYIKILYTAMKIITGKDRYKALNTCGTHLIVAMLIYSCGLLSSIVYRIGTSISINVQNLVSAIYFLFPAAVNPLIYGVRVKEIRVSLKKAYGRKKLEFGGVTQTT